MTLFGPDLTSLVQAYIAAEPNRARGGIVAITGFEYQIWCYLADYVEDIRAGKLATARQFDNAFETLSDHTRGSAGATVCVQVKSHLDPHAMSLAAAEFAAIERFMNSQGGDELRRLLTYEVVAKNGTASNWANIQLPAEVTKREPDLKTHFDRIRAEGRLSAPRFEVDPHWKLISAVYQSLEDPFGFARRAFELCMRRTREPSTAEFVRKEIAEYYQASLRDRARSSRTLSASDFSSDPGGRGISLARTPTLSDLRSGRFMERPTQVAAVIEVLRELANDERAVHESAIPVLWIDGRSGSGKSVLLLQLMRHLVLERSASAVWFTNGTEELGAALENLANSPLYVRPDFLVVDDIYDPQARDDFDVARLTRMIVHSGITTWPTIVTCGPTEFRQDLERDCRGEGFRITPWHLSALDRSETIALRNWFQARTGRLPPPGPASAEKRALMISVMFELEYGDLRPFALRFRNRLAQERLDDVLTVPLALNRLYIWTPRSWLSVDDEARLERLNQDGDFSVLSVEGRGNDLFKLTHPHLSDAIYRAVHAGAIPATFARHLVVAFSRALASHPATAVRLLRTVASAPSRLDIVDDQVLAEGMTACWNTWDKRSLSPHIATEIWVDWARWAARQSTVAALLPVSALEVAVEMLMADHQQWSSLWSRLWAAVPGEPSLTARALHWLPSHLEANGWNAVWRRVAEQALQDARVMQGPTELSKLVCDMGLRWLRSSTHVVGWSRVWEDLIDSRDLLDPAMVADVIAQGVAWVFEHDQARDWNFVWEKLAALSDMGTGSIPRDDIYGLGVRWLRQAQDHPGWPFVWQHFMALRALPAEIDRSDLLVLADAWCTGRESDPGWIFVATKRAAEGDDAVKRSVWTGLVARIERHQESSRWPGNWFNLFEVRKAELPRELRRRLFVAACEWVAADDEREGTVFVLTNVVLNLSIFLDVADEDGLLDRASNLLARTIGSQDRYWTHLWTAVSRHVRKWPPEKAAPFLGRLQMLGRDWLAKSTHLSDGTWSQMYRHVYRVGVDEEVITRKLAVKGIVQGLIADAAPFAALLYSTPGEAPPDELLDWLRRWFSGYARGSGGFSVWWRFDRATRAAMAQGNNGGWATLRAVLDDHRPAQADRWEQIVERYRRGELVTGRVVRVVNRKKWGGRPRRGFVVDIGMNAFLSLDEACIEPGSEGRLFGLDLELDIMRLDEIRLQVDVSRRTAVERYKGAVGRLFVGDVVEGRVTRILARGVLVDLGFVDAFLSLENTTDHASSGQPQLFTIGQVVAARILNMDDARHLISLTMKSVGDVS